LTYQTQREGENVKSTATFLTVILAALGITSAGNAALPDPGVEIVPGRTALLITDPQNDFLSPKGVAWTVVANTVWTTKEAVQKINTAK
jgi:hypothetical protein